MVTDNNKRFSIAEYREYIELKTKMEIIKRQYISYGCCSLENFNNITGYDIEELEK